MHRMLACLFPAFIFWWPLIVTVSTSVGALPTTKLPHGERSDTESTASVVTSYSTNSDNTSLATSAMNSSNPVRTYSTLVVVGFSTLAGIFSLVGTVGNGLVILAYCSYRKVRTSANTFILSISISDILLTGVQYPTRMAAMITGAPPLGDAVCQILGALTFFSVYVSFFSVVLIALSRYVRITKSLDTYKKLFRPFKSFLWVLLSWVVSGLLVVPGFLGYGKFGWNTRNRQCGLVYPHPYQPHYFSNVFGVTCWVTLCLAVAIFLKIYFDVKNSVMTLVEANPNEYQDQHVPKRLIKQTKHMFIFFCALAISVSPHALLTSIDVHAKFMPTALRIMVILLFGLNHVVNPFLYAWKLTIFKRAFSALFHCKRHLPSQPRAAVNRY
ncbi:melatonin-related receptor-like [Branchiostoma floridae x Branchiostoma belcheri]